MFWLIMYALRLKEKQISAIPLLKSWGTISSKVYLQLCRKHSRKVTVLYCHDKADSVINDR